MFEASPRPKVDWMPKCRNHETGSVGMHPDILSLRFPEGTLPVRGYRCPRCGEERLLGTTLKDAQSLAERLGLFGLQDVQRRKILQIGNSMGVSIDPELLRDIIPGAGVGTEVLIGKKGDAIALRPIDDGQEPAPVIGEARFLSDFSVEFTLLGPTTSRDLEADVDTQDVDSGEGAEPELTFKGRHLHVVDQTSLFDEDEESIVPSGNSKKLKLVGGT